MSSPLSLYFSPQPSFFSALSCLLEPLCLLPTSLSPRHLHRFCRHGNWEYAHWPPHVGALLQPSWPVQRTWNMTLLVRCHAQTSTSPWKRSTCIVLTATQNRDHANSYPEARLHSILEAPSFRTHPLDAIATCNHNTHITHPTVLAAWSALSLGGARGAHHLPLTRSALPLGGARRHRTQPDPVHPFFWRQLKPRSPAHKE